MKLSIAEIGNVRYERALLLQEYLREKRFAGKIEDTLILLEHDSVITLGRRGKFENILIGREKLKGKNVEIIEVTRGGDVTYHGPGQLVGYLIFDLKNHGSSVGKFVWNIEEVFIRLMMDFYHVEARRDSGVYTGVWVGNDKITAIGLAVRRWVTMHGFAFNINTDLDCYRWINPCGITDRGVTSIEKIMGCRQDSDRVSTAVSEKFCEIFGMEGEKKKGGLNEIFPGFSEWTLNR
ncbi:MAG: lipoyl(octanoyl) transferase LipB [Brevinematales bacterium]|jgi:lipoyl(octanoyl) transferase